MTKMLETAKKVERLERELAEARDQLRQDLLAAHEAGESVSELARRLDVSRTRIYQMIGRD